MNIKKLLNKKERIHWYSAAILTYLFIKIGILMSPSTNIPHISFYYLYAGIVIITSFLIFYSKFANKIRLGLFSVMAVLLVISLMFDLYQERGHIGIVAGDITEGLPFCHIALVNEILTVPLLKTFVFPGSLEGHYYSIYAMIIIWFWATILIGKGWCSWGCFYGGWDSFFSSIRKKPLVKISEKTSNRLRLIPYAFLITMAVSSLVFYTPFFCSYICPFKTVTEFSQVTSFISWMVFIISVGGFITFCIVTPIFFGKRIWCTYLCPFGALQGLVGRVFRVFKLKIDKNKCINCKKCVNTCIAAGITETSLEKKKFTFNCSLCGSCIETCPKNAIFVTAFGIKQTPKNIIVKITEKLPKNNIIQGIRIVAVNIFDDVINPHSFLFFFTLAVFYTFFTGFFFSSIKHLFNLFGGLL